MERPVVNFDLYFLPCEFESIATLLLDGLTAPLHDQNYHSR